MRNILHKRDGNEREGSSRMFHSSDLRGWTTSRAKHGHLFKSDNSFTFSYCLTFMRGEHYARLKHAKALTHARICKCARTRFAALRAALGRQKKISRAGPHSQSAILSAKPALLTNHQQSKISSVRAEFKVFRGQINSLLRSSRSSPIPRERP